MRNGDRFGSRSPQICIETSGEVSLARPQMLRLDQLPDDWAEEFADCIASFVFAEGSPAQYSNTPVTTAISWVSLLPPIEPLPPDVPPEADVPLPDEAESVEPPELLEVNPPGVEPLADG